MDEARGREALQEVDVGQADAHEGARALTRKVLRMGIFWPTTHQDAVKLTRKCVECQTYSPVQGNPPAPPINISSPWTFYQWEIDIVGPFPEDPGRQMIKFMWKNIMNKFGTPKVLISNNGLQFAENPFKDWCAGKGITQRFTSVAHLNQMGRHKYPIRQS